VASGYRLTKIKPKSHHRQLLHGEELGLVLPNVLSTEAVRRTVEVLREFFDEADVVLCGSLRVMTTLEFFQHDSA
jgi:hypothetical protein